MTVMHASIPLPTLLSHALVAFTIEFDNEAEGQIIHQTTKHGASPGSRQGPWLVSLVMWANCMQFIDKKGVSVRELESRAGQRRIWRAWRGGDTLLSNHIRRTPGQSRRAPRGWFAPPSPAARLRKSGDPCSASSRNA